ncbi:MAG: hypothetical protein LDL24_10985 [Treponema sp.]|nr:hypothetical protein [Treponema sp.]
MRRMLPLLLINLMLLSCSRSVPQIQNYSYKLIYTETSKGIKEQLSLFVLAQDEDGNEDLDNIYIIHDDQQLYWTLNSADWLKVNRDNQLWIGSHSISMVDESPLPRGLYRIILTDKGGERTEKMIGLDAPLQSRYAFPQLQIMGDSYTIRSAYPKNTILCYDKDGALVKSVPVSASSGSLKALGIPSTVFAFALWAEDPEGNTGALTKTIPANF